MAELEGVTVSRRQGRPLTREEAEQKLRDRGTRRRGLAERARLQLHRSRAPVYEGPLLRRRIDHLSCARRVRRHP